MEDVELCKWLRENSSGIYRNSEVAADRIEKLLHDNERLWEEVDKQSQRCSDAENRLGSALDKIKTVINEL